jgi:hypothetical protein
VASTFEFYLKKILKMIKIAIILALAAVVSCRPDHPPPAPYRPPPPAYKPAPYKPVEKLPPKPFAYQYGVKDDYSGAAFSKDESQDAYGALQGSYTVALPDGRTQIVTYHADHENGYIADVKYEGVAVYPPEPKEGYGYHPAPAPYRPKPVYAPKPAYHPAPPPPKYKPA